MSSMHDHDEKWDQSDHLALLRLVGQGASYKQIASQMGRTKGAVRSKLYRIRKAVR